MKQPDPSDDPLDPSADDWEERVREMLTGDDADPEVVELGREMARDAIRVSKGELRRRRVRCPVSTQNPRDVRRYERRRLRPGGIEE